MTQNPESSTWLVSVQADVTDSEFELGTVEAETSFEAAVAAVRLVRRDLKERRSEWRELYPQGSRSLLVHARHPKEGRVSHQIEATF